MIDSAAVFDSLLMPSDCNANFCVQSETSSSAVALIDLLNSVPAWNLLCASLNMQDCILARTELSFEAVVVLLEDGMNCDNCEQAAIRQAIAIIDIFFIVNLLEVNMIVHAK